MSENESRPGQIVWHDLTVPDAHRVREFYAQVVGWRAEPHSMGEYDDYNMLAPDGACVAGICHARGTNADIPPQWLLYIQVPDADECARRCAAAGGTVVDGPRDMGRYRFCVIQDPAGAVAAVISG